MEIRGFGTERDYVLRPKEVRTLSFTERLAAGVGKHEGGEQDGSAEQQGVGGQAQGTGQGGQPSLLPAASPPPPVP